MCLYTNKRGKHHHTSFKNFLLNSFHVSDIFQRRYLIQTPTKKFKQLQIDQFTKRTVPLASKCKLQVSKPKNMLACLVGRRGANLTMRFACFGSTTEAKTLSAQKNTKAKHQSFNFKEKGTKHKEEKSRALSPVGWL